MGCNTSQELKNKDATTAAAECDTSNNEEGATNEPIENGEPHQTNGTSNNGDETASAGANSSHQHHQKNHSKSNSIITNGDANATKHAKDAGATSSSTSSSPTLTKQNGAVAMLNGAHNGVVGDYDMEEARKCDKAEISELNDMELGEDEERRFDGRDEFVPEVEVYIPQHHHHGSQKVRRNPLRNLDLDFKFDVNSF